MERFKNLAALVYDYLVVGKQKAIVAFVVATVGTFAAKHGFTVDVTLTNALQAVLVGLIAHGSVYLTANK